MAFYKAVIRRLHTSAIIPNFNRVVAYDNQRENTCPLIEHLNFIVCLGIRLQQFVFIVHTIIGVIGVPDK